MQTYSDIVRVRIIYTVRVVGGHSCVQLLYNTSHFNAATLPCGISIHGRAPVHSIITGLKVVQCQH